MITRDKYNQLTYVKLRSFNFSAIAKTECTDYLTSAELDCLEDYLITTYGDGIPIWTINDLFETGKILRDYAEDFNDDIELEIWRRKCNASTMKNKVTVHKNLHNKYD